MDKNIFFEPKDLLKIPDFQNLSQTAMYRKYKKIRDAYEKTKKQRVTYEEVAEFLGITEEKLRNIVRSFHNIPA